MAKSRSTNTPSSQTAHNRATGLIRRLEIVILIAILLVGAGIRVAYLMELRHDPGLDDPPVDAGFSLYWARGLATRNWALPPDANGRDPQIHSRAYIRPPGYTFVLAGLYRLTAGHQLAIRALQMAGGLLGVVLTFVVGRRLLGPAVGLTWAGLMATYWGFVYFEGTLTGAWLVIDLLLAVVWGLQAFARRPSLVRGASIGALVGLSALVRPNAMFLAPVVACWMLWISRTGRLRLRFAPIAAAAVAGCLVLAPTTIRNLRVSGHLVPISGNGGLTLFHGNNPAATGFSTSAVGDVGVFGSPWQVSDVVARLESQLGRRLDFVEASRHLGGEAREWMLHNSGTTLRLVGRRAALFWGPDEIAHNYPVAADRLASPILRRLPSSYAMAVAGGLVGLGLLIFDSRRQPNDAAPAVTAASRATLVAMVLIVVTWWLSFLPFFVTSLYRMPVVPFLLLGLAATVVTAGRWIRRGRSRSAALLAVLLGALWLVVRIPIVPVDPGTTERHLMRGAQWRHHGDLDKAEAEFEEALRLRPGSTAAANGLGAIRLAQGRPGEARSLFEAAVRSSPKNPLARFNLGLAFAGNGQWQLAATSFEAATDLAPSLVQAHSDLGIALEHLGRPADAAVAYEDALSLQPDLPDAANNLAWILATSPDSALRDGLRAVTLARVAVATANTASTLDTLAAAYAEAGSFPDAIATAERALAAAGDNETDLQRDISARLDGYRIGQPYRSEPIKEIPDGFDTVEARPPVVR
jgi:tetratricopeptide (TPR) repeat protein